MSNAFNPGSGAVTRLAVTASAQTLTLPAAFAQGAGPQAVRIAVIGTDNVYLRFGTPAPTAAATTAMCMFANSVESFTLPPGTTTISAISAGTASTIEVVMGCGQ